MNKIKFRILGRKPLPIFTPMIDGNSITVLYDTGAYVSVWTGTEEWFHQVFKDAYRAGQHKLGGFGGGGMTVPLYKIPCLGIGATFMDIPICIQKNRYRDIDLVLAGALFSNNANVIIAYKTLQGVIQFETNYDKYNLIQPAGVDVNCIPIPITDSNNFTTPDDFLYNRAPQRWKDMYDRETVIKMVKEKGV